MIKISNLSFGYSNKKLLYSDLSLNIKGGNIYGLLGKNGAGKSTLLKNISGTLFPKKGKVIVNGSIPQRRKPSFLNTVYFISEDVTLPPLTLRKYLDLFSVFYPNFNVDELNTFLKELAVSVPAKLSALSFGQQKKFSIAFALACNTQILLMDEPTNGLDIPSKAQFRQLIASVMTDDRIIIISTHQTRDLENLIDQVIIVDDGQLLLNESVDSITEKLIFETVSTPPNDNRILYVEKHLKGVSLVRENTSGEDTRINLENLFNGVTSKPQLAKEIFTSNTK
ncbi:ABC-2 type transport system ATP-binding protein [Chitinophaga sp. YR573]|uniref:ABC transporter ATP-binding protein n=1 Tax=Chitinophaga sp. YR573 TaxID=1881040 RepID=UPI0008D12962|nr:ABC transporter ATP-binding protein [Chitinophaga sp. YR573]SEV95944.1 ABC-2 type transport system ATP-binding protein [Chitinophaga sp. YR573]